MSETREDALGFWERAGVAGYADHSIRTATARVDAASRAAADAAEIASSRERVRQKQLQLRQSLADKETAATQPFNALELPSIRSIREQKQPVPFSEAIRSAAEEGWNDY